MSAVKTASLTEIPTGVWAVDPDHSSIGFSVRHMGIAKVRGQFTKFEGKIDASDSEVSLTGTVEVSSVTTNSEQRDTHLGAPDFFDRERYPEISFAAAAPTLDGDGGISLEGEITLKGVTKSIELAGTISGPDEDPWGNQRVGLELSGSLDRRDFGLEFNQPLPSGNLLVSNDVKLILDVSAVKGA